MTQHSFIKLKIQFTVKQSVVRTNGRPRIVAVCIYDFRDAIVEGIVNEFHRVSSVRSDSARSAGRVGVVIKF